MLKTSQKIHIFWQFWDAHKRGNTYSFLYQMIPAACSGSGGVKSTALVQIWFPSLSAYRMK